MSEFKAPFTCCHCGHEWNCPCPKTAKHIQTAVKVNKDGPYCELCRNLFGALVQAEVRELPGKARQIKSILDKLKL